MQRAALQVRRSTPERECWPPLDDVSPDLGMLTKTPLEQGWSGIFLGFRWSLQICDHRARQIAEKRLTTIRLTASGTTRNGVGARAQRGEGATRRGPHPASPKRRGASFSAENPPSQISGMLQGEAEKQGSGVGGRGPEKVSDGAKRRGGRKGEGLPNPESRILGFESRIPKRALA